MMPGIETSGIETLLRKLVEKLDLPINDNELSKMNELPNHIESGNKTRIEAPDISYIERTSRSALMEQEQCSLKNPEGKDAKEKIGLTEEQKKQIKEETGWSDEIIEAIKSKEQYEIYKKADLHEAVIDGRKCLVKDIDMDYVDPKTGMTNRELMKNGRSPIDSKTGEKVELHHIGQEFDSPLAELTENTEHGDGNDAILHDKKAESWRQDSEKEKIYNNVQRPNHWKARAKEA